MRSTARELGLVAVASLALAVALLGVTERTALQKDDAGQYWAMAEQPAALTRLPYTFRVLSPALAGAWPGDRATGFVVVTVVSLAAAGVGLYAYQRAIGLSRVAAGCGAGLLLVSGASTRVLTTPVYVDGLSYAFEAITMAAIATGGFALTLASLCVGVLNRETALLLIPTALLAPAFALRAFRTRALLVTAPLMLFVALVVAKLAMGGVLAGRVDAATLAPFARTFAQTVPTWGEMFDIWSVFGAMWLLAAINLPGPTTAQRCALVFGVLVGLQLIVSRGDEGRNLSHIFVIVIPLAMLEVDRLRRAWPRLWLPLTVILVYALACSMVNARWTVLDPAAARYAIVGAGSLVAVGLVVATRVRLALAAGGTPLQGATP
jgi:hypothetical protein